MSGRVSGLDCVETYQAAEAADDEGPEETTEEHHKYNYDVPATTAETVS